MSGFNVLITNLFEMCGADEIHYSVEDNDDTIAYFANKYKAMILSRDSDFKVY